MKNISSRNFYTLLGPEYQKAFKKRLNYINSVDALVITHTKKAKVKDWLDVGTGNGDRLSRLLKNTIEPDGEVICLEPSSYMYQEATNKLGTKASILQMTLEEFAKSSKNRFSLITALWNVIGHSERPKDFLGTAYKLLENEGVLIIDANNRYNIRQYGALKVLRNMAYDILGLGTSGIFKLAIDCYSSFTNVYIASPNEMRKACKRLDGASFNIQYIDYTTGNSATWLTGQMVVCVKKCQGQC